ncbi:hypothetical protein QVD17_38933 [Tagetes erecta]|uniref:Pentatricopeptide repeat-containing protein n=1 Tax=Tagetes erecta TaxID=13708 RepID=A0AAD8JMP6_TARER|nr:hypothetical protein QVD17_38933 [Tagetes erecta]
MINTCFNFNLIKPHLKHKLISFLTRSSPNPHQFRHFSSQTRTYSNKQQSFLSLFNKSNTKLEIEQLHAHIIRTGFNQNLFVVGKIIVFCAVSDQCLMDYAVSIFEKINNPDGFLWNTMIRGFAKMNQVDNVFCYYKMMLEHEQSVDNFTLSFLLKASGQFGSVLLGKQLHCSVVKRGFDCHVFVRNTLIHMYGMLKDVIVARQLFDEMSEPDIVTWNTIIDCYVCCGKHREALDLFSRMQNACVTPDDATLVVVLSACAALGVLDIGRWVHLIVNRRCLMKDVMIANSVMHMYMRCGEIQEACKIFDKMSDKNLVTWNTMILGHATHGHVQDALSLFSSMINEKLGPPDEVTFLGVLTACSHGGMIKEGRQYFNRMTDEYNIKPTIKHFGCMVDMLSRVGLVTEAYDLVQNMPMKCNAIVLRTLLAGCNMHGNIKLAENVRRRLLEVDPDHSSDYVLLANTYASLDDWNQVSLIRRSMAANKVQKPSPGNSFIPVRG